MFRRFDVLTFRLSVCGVIAALLLSVGLAAAGGPRGAPPVPVAASWDQPAGLLTIVFDRAVTVSAWPPLPLAPGVFAVAAGAQQWRTALTVEIGGTANEPNRHLLIAFGDPVAADPPADGAVCAYAGDFLTGLGGAPVAPFSDFPCAQ